VHFKGTVAVEDLNLEVPTGRITGLIGPNGAGKTTTFNFCSGLIRPVHGRLLFDGRDITSLSPSARARVGIGRTFQLVNLFDSMTVRQNVELGAEGAMAGGDPLKQISATPQQRHLVRGAAAAAMELTGITELAEREARTLSTGQKRLVELARCLAGDFDVLLLDEPSNGLDSIESSKLGELLNRIVAERGVGILLVEHNMSLVAEVCSYVYVLDFGQLIFEGSAAETMASEVVAAAYLGGTVERSH
jgi:ABC-type branched-subunit amino acid transport system ATPase component